MVYFTDLPVFESLIPVLFIYVYGRTLVHCHIQLAFSTDYVRYV